MMIGRVVNQAAQDSTSPPLSASYSSGGPAHTNNNLERHVLADKGITYATRLGALGYNDKR